MWLGGLLCVVGLICISFCIRRKVVHHDPRPAFYFRDGLIYRVTKHQLADKKFKKEVKEGFLNLIRGGANDP